MGSWGRGGRGQRERERERERMSELLLSKKLPGRRQGGERDPEEKA
jgi:hypothetical protein